MSSMNIVELTVKNFRAINSANINLNGITVVAGVNGCGKSTLSKLLYFIFHNANEYEELAAHSTMKAMRKYLFTLDQLQFYVYQVKRSSYKDIFEYSRLKPAVLRDPQNFLDTIKDLCNTFIDHYNTLPEKEKTSSILNRLQVILSNSLKVSGNTSMPQLINKLIEEISNMLEKLSKTYIERPYRLFKNSLLLQFSGDFPEELIVKEYGDSIISNDNPNIPYPHFIKKVVYIDTPMIMDLTPTAGSPIYWRDLYNQLKQHSKKGYKTSINKLIREQIIQGDTYFDDKSFTEGFKYKRLNDKQEFDLIECATGIKSFSLLQMLLKNLFMDENTLMILDEPEAHLHPQWIVEYARLIVLLHKRIGVKFFITSHSTDLVSAIHYISEKEKQSSATSFYVAEEDKRRLNCFRFKYLGHDIEPIFESFNKSYQTLDAYVK